MTQDSKGASMPHVDEGTLHAYLDGELPSAERKTVEVHLAECASCRATLADERALLERASALLGAARPADRPAPPFEQLRPPRSPKRSLWHVRVPVAWAASIALALGVGYYLRQPEAALVSRERASVMDRRDVAAYSEADRPARADEERKETARAPAAFGPKRAAAPLPARLYDSAAAAADKATKGVATAGQRVDSVAAAERASVSREPTAGPVVIPPPTATPPVRNATPAAVAQSKANEPVLLQEAIVTSGAAVNGVVDLRGRATTTKWPIISRGTARTLLGTDPVGLPGLARQIRRSPTADGTVVVEQRIDSATTIQIFQRQSGMDSSGGATWYRRGAPSDTLFARQQEREIAPADRLARYVGKLRVEIAGPLTTDSLNKLLDQVQPLP